LSVGRGLIVGGRNSGEGDGGVVIGGGGRAKKSKQLSPTVHYEASEFRLYLAPSAPFAVACAR